MNIVLWSSYLILKTRCDAFEDILTGIERYLIWLGIGKTRWREVFNIVFPECSGNVISKVNALLARTRCINLDFSKLYFVGICN